MAGPVSCLTCAHSTPGVLGTRPNCSLTPVVKRACLLQGLESWEEKEKAIPTEDTTIDIVQICETCARFSRWCGREEEYECELDTDDVLECVTHQQSKWIPSQEGKVTVSSTVSCTEGERTLGETVENKRPLGVLTKKRWLEQRVQELTRALSEYVAAHKYCDLRHWVLELDEHLEEIELEEESSQ